MAVCCQNLPLGALSNRIAPSVLVGELFKKFGLFMNTGYITLSSLRTTYVYIFVYITWRKYDINI